MPFYGGAFRVGGVVFYEAGGAANSFGQMQLYQDVGVGLRTLIPQTSRELFRFDFALPLVDADPGVSRRAFRVFIRGFDSYF